MKNLNDILTSFSFYLTYMKKVSLPVNLDLLFKRSVCEQYVIHIYCVTFTWTLSVSYSVGLTFDKPTLPHLACTCHGEQGNLCLCVDFFILT